MYPEESFCAANAEGWTLGLRCVSTILKMGSSYGCFERRTKFKLRKRYTGNFVPLLPGMELKRGVRDEDSGILVR